MINCPNCGCGMPKAEYALCNNCGHQIILPYDSEPESTVVRKDLYEGPLPEIRRGPGPVPDKRY